ncbi:PREDICTED: uncharacterized protein LOC106146950 [Chinchilla lanigera]|uniref:uncharacterized protein LOC106146950 n=1 Tax=Chinchilla lanigera TaxID=34839 RepID=UPI0006979A0E|nr:PREDICTED: uncharacterized protein LOC106146950 [Chinchilla lanigera]
MCCPREVLTEVLPGDLPGAGGGGQLRSWEAVQGSSFPGATSCPGWGSDTPQDDCEEGLRTQETRFSQSGPERGCDTLRPQEPRGKDLPAQPRSWLCTHRGLCGPPRPEDHSLHRKGPGWWQWRRRPRCALRERLLCEEAGSACLTNSGGPRRLCGRCPRPEASATTASRQLGCRATLGLLLCWRTPGGAGDSGVHRQRGCSNPDGTWRSGSDQPGVKGECEFLRRYSWVPQRADGVSRLCQERGADSDPGLPMGPPADQDVPPPSTVSVRLFVLRVPPGRGAAPWALAPAEPMATKGRSEATHRPASNCTDLGEALSSRAEPSPSRLGHEEVALPSRRAQGGAPATVPTTCPQAGLCPGTF